MNNALPYIDRYFNGELLPAEKSAFESRCLADPAFAKTVAFYISLHDHLQEQWKQQKIQDFAKLEEPDVFNDANAFGMNGDFNPSLHDLKKENKLPKAIENGGKRQNSLSPTEEAFVKAPSQEKTSRKQTAKIINFKAIKKLAVAAAATGVIILTFTLFEQKNKEAALATKNKKEGATNNNTVPDTSSQANIIIDTTNQAINKNGVPKKRIDQLEAQSLYAQNFSADATPKETGGILEEAFAYYKSGSYKKASHEYTDVIAIVESLETRTSEDEKSDEEKKQLLFYAHYYNALSYLADDKTEEAISELKGIKQSPDKFWQGKLQWYLALAYLKTGQVEEAEILLTQIAGSKEVGRYRQKAMSLVTKLKDIPTK